MHQNQTSKTTQGYIIYLANQGIIKVTLE